MMLQNLIEKGNSYSKVEIENQLVPQKDEVDHLREVLKVIRELVRARQPFKETLHDPLPCETLDYFVSSLHIVL